MIAAGGFAAYLALSLRDWARLDSPSFDLAIFTQIIQGYAHLSAPVVDIKGPGFNAFGDHFSPLLALLAPFYRVFPTPVTLLVAQCVLVAFSAVPLGWAARRRLGKWPAIALTCAYILSWGLQSGIAVQFHEYALAVPLLALALVWFIEEHWIATAITAGLLIGVKEDLVFTAGALGLALVGAGWAGRHRTMDDAAPTPRTMHDAAPTPRTMHDPAPPPRTLHDAAPTPPPKPAAAPT
ncbi:MAG: DUF2079 domain-containing protein, partial [Bifidobacteriaceae bacterium]|nr:DUF2079 domain-containing protein [Bifidobacteriaceae bacterium]